MISLMQYEMERLETRWLHGYYTSDIYTLQKSHSRPFLRQHFDTLFMDIDCGFVLPLNNVVDDTTYAAIEKVVRERQAKHNGTMHFQEWADQNYEKVRQVIHNEHPHYNDDDLHQQTTTKLNLIWRFM